MLKPDFGIGPGGLHVIKWTPERKAYLAFCAQQGLSASAIAVHLGLLERQGPRISEACRRFGIKLRGVPGRTVGATSYTHVLISEPHLKILRRMAIERKVRPHDVLANIVRLVFEQGETFLANLLDEE